MAGRGSPLRRLLGLETEYAIRFAAQSPDAASHGRSSEEALGGSLARGGFARQRWNSMDQERPDEAPDAASAASSDRQRSGETHPGNDVIFQALREALSHIVATRPGHSAPGRDQLFLENGGAFYYEYLPHCLWGGLVEGATPECSSPGQLLLYQRAQEALLREVLPRAERKLRARGFPGKLGLVKNSRDAEGHTYGSQENYEATLARGFGLFVYRFVVALLLPILILQTLVTYALVVLILIGVIAGTIVMLFVPRWRQKLERLSEDQRRIEIALGRFQLYFTLIVTWPITTLFARLLELTAFRRIRRQTLAFLVTRSVLAGAGSVDGERRFRLCEKAQVVRRIIRRTILPEDRPIFDTGNLIKMLAAPFNFQVRPVTALFRRRQRLQLNVADSNRAQVAEYLKVATAALVLDMVEEGFLSDAPRLARPLEALRATVEDPTLEARHALRGQEPRTALEIQRFYLARAREYLRRSKAASIEARQVVELWDETLRALENNEPERLVGRLDWVTKRYLLEHCGADDDAAVLKTIDLRYHELGEGYFDQLETAGQAQRLVEESDVARATREPPHDTPAFVRGGLIRRRAGSPVRVVVSWDSAHIGQRLRGKVIPFRPRRS